MTDFRVPVDENYARKHNEFFRDAKNLQISAGLLALILIAIIAILVYANGFTGRTIGFTLSLGLFALLCLIMIPILPRAMGSPQAYYDMYKLAPAVVAKVNPRDMVLLSLVDASLDAAQNTSPNLLAPALAVRTVSSIPGVPREVGARVPAMAVTSVQTNADKRHYQEVIPMPVAWGTPDESVWQDAERAIPTNQWKKLEGLIDRWEETQAQKRNLLLLKKR